LHEEDLKYSNEIDNDENLQSVEDMKVEENLKLDLEIYTDRLIAKANKE